MSVRLLMLVVPDDHGGMGHDQVGFVLDFQDGSPIVGGWLIDPNTTTFRDVTEDETLSHPQAGVTMGGAFPTVRGLADFTQYAVVELDGTLVYAPKEVFRYARRDPSMWLGDPPR